jgi:hypothetical protein
VLAALGLAVAGLFAFNVLALAGDTSPLIWAAAAIVSSALRRAR